MDPIMQNYPSNPKKCEKLKKKERYERYIDREWVGGVISGFQATVAK